MKHKVSGKDVKLRRQFEDLRRRLCSEAFAHVRGYPLWTWVASSDRRLPRSLLQIPLGDLCQKSYEGLRYTPGIGEVKFRSFLRLLARVARDGGAVTALKTDVPPEDSHFDAKLVTEQNWQTYVATVRRLRIHTSPLGQLIPSLRQIPFSMWAVPLEELLGSSLAELSNRPGYGEKRVRAILETVYHLHGFGWQWPDTHLRMRLLPQNIADLEDWLHGVRRNGRCPSSDELRIQVLERVFLQVQCDLQPAHLELIRGRLGIDREVQSLPAIAAEFKLTRARIYQMIRECAAAFFVRWPTGKLSLLDFANYLDNHNSDQGGLIRLLAKLLYASPQTDGHPDGRPAMAYE